MKHIEIPVTQMMEDDLADCRRMGGRAGCGLCCLNGGEWYGCLARYRWTDDEEKRRLDVWKVSVKDD